MSEILAAAKRSTNAELIAECRQLGYLRDDARVLDPTFGLGTFWRDWRPADLVACDLNPAKSPLGVSVDFTALPWEDEAFDAVVFDPPYKLSGTATASVDDRYGVDGYMPIADRHQLILVGLAECIRVLRVGGRLLVKVQDQVASGRVWWQTDMVTRAAEEQGCRKVDALLFLGGRSQPKGRRQVHARRNYSTLLVFVKESAS